MRFDVRDGLIAAGVAAILLITGLSARPAGNGAAIAGCVLLAAGGLALAWRRRFPVAVLIATGLCAVGYQTAGFDVFAVAYLVAVYAAMRAGERAATVTTSVLMLAALPLAAMASGLPATSSRGVLELAWLIAAGAAGEALRQAERRADEAERTREQSALRRAGEERLHIARELHDSLTHQISVIKLQAEVAVHLARKRGEPVPDALVAIRDAGREAARELRETLTVLRDDGDFSRYGLEHVPGLLDGVRAAGVNATLTTTGDPGALPPAVDRTGYRIVQESLTNVVRHAAAGSATVSIDYRPGSVRIRVDDDGAAGPASPQPGVGLLGMRERVTALGGTLRAEPRDEGGFTVHAELPLAGAS
ncbi:sensor histidine kinase [Actinoplanes utahensis]|uniref:histidine kinase n=1 Tax=Actinoplanes utahensis TaxID=1869 RepID=A0A0A6UJ48_ACTUT|nr:histidine kinase [Actinoplanes utahensis]KHD75108.1 histidine kinase [Actinoplanes utahensis]GIF27042.1 two-component sensor histidine kinase [Actinoplanes utahensis]